MSRSVPRSPQETSIPDGPAPQTSLWGRGGRRSVQTPSVPVHTHTPLPAVSPSHTLRHKVGPRCCLGLQVPPRHRGINQVGGSCQMYPQTEGAAPAPMHTPARLPALHRRRPRKLRCSHRVCPSQDVAPAGAQFSPCHQPKERVKVRCLLTTIHGWLDAHPA